MPWLVLATLALLTLWSFWQRYELLTSSPYPMGVDGYYYAIQVRSLLAGGTLAVPASPVCFWFMAIPAALSDPLTGAKIGAALAGALAIVPAYVLGRRASGSRSCGLVAAVLVATSAGSFYLTTEFVKTSLGLTVALTYLCALAWALDAPAEHGPGTRRIALRVLVPASLLLTTIATHKLGAAMAVLASLPPLVLAMRQARRPAALRGLVIMLAITVGMALLAGVLAPERFVSPGDLQIVSRAFTSSMDWSFAALRPASGRALVFQYEVLIAALLAALPLTGWLCCTCGPERRARLCTWANLGPASSSPSGSSPGTSSGTLSGTSMGHALVLGPAALALGAALPFWNVSDPQGLAFRLRVVAFVPLALCAAWLCGRVTARLARLWRAALLIPFVIAFCLARSDPGTEGVVTVHPAMQAAVRALRGVVPREHVIIVPERHIAFMVAWYTDSHVRLRPEPVPEDRRWRLVPKALMSPALEAAMDHARAHAPPGLPRPRSLHPLHPNGLVLMPEATWQWILDRLPPGLRDHHARWITI